MNYEKLKAALEGGKKGTIGTLWNMSSEGPGLTTFEPGQNAEMISHLRQLADTLEQHPETVCTVVLMAGIKCIDENGDEGVKTMHITAGNQSGIAACHLQFEEDGASAFKSCVPALLHHVLSTRLSSDEDGKVLYPHVDNPKFTEDDALGEASGISD